MKFELAANNRFTPRADIFSVFERAFAILCDELKITDKDYTVTIEFESSGPKNAEAYVNSDSLHPVQMGMRPGGTAHMLLSFCHEMVHVQDLVDGRLRSCIGKTKEDSYKEYDGKRFTINELKVMEDVFSPISQPEERKAYEMMFPLFRKVVSLLPKTDIDLMNSECKCLQKMIDFDEKPAIKEAIEMDERIKREPLFGLLTALANHDGMRRLKH